MTVDFPQVSGSLQQVSLHPGDSRERGTAAQSPEGAPAAFDRGTAGRALFNGALDVPYVSGCWGYVAKALQRPGKLRALGGSRSAASFTRGRMKSLGEARSSLVPSVLCASPNFGPVGRCEMRSGHLTGRRMSNAGRLPCTQRPYTQRVRCHLLDGEVRR